MSLFPPKVKLSFKRLHTPELSIPSARPLSPCIIEPYIKVDGKDEENKGYIPVSLLMKAIDDDRMLNIAVAGNYGVGKSSIINTAEKQLSKGLFPKHRFIRISLASLLTQENKLKKKAQDREQEKNDPNISEQEGDKSNMLNHSVEVGVTDKQIEYSILQQILYHDRPQKTPKSRIRRIHKTRRIKPYWIAFWCILVFVSLLLLLNPSWFSLADYYDLKTANDCVIYLFKWGPIIALGLVFILVCRYVSRHYTFSLARVGYKDIEMKVKEDMSIFNAFMDEIVYFFESTKYDVVVFEDLDRFENREVIFYKLRELNTILNNSRSLNRPINFVYAVLDDLFDSTERVKFFDYIITVIPVINSLNSYNKLKEYIQPPEMLEKLGRKELLNLCDYFQDMRLLLNIVNEFNQFVPLLDTSALSEKNLFGLIVYKNYVPSDFSKMYNKSGVVATAIEKADETRENILNDIEKRISNHQASITAIREEYEKKEIELRKSYLEKGKALSTYSTSILNIRIGNDTYLFDSVAENASLFRKVREGVARYVINGGSLVNIPSFSTVEQNMGGAGSYDATFKRYSTERDNKISELEKSMISLTEEGNHLPRTIHGIYQKDTKTLEGILASIQDESKRALLRFLILNGYLDRHYQYYISYFYPNALKREDRIFVMRAGRHEGPQHEVKLEKMDEILKRFTAKDFETNASLLNVDLVREIYQNQKYEGYCPSVCKLIKASKNLDFVLAAYKALVPVKNAFFYQLLRAYDFWDDIIGYDESKQNDLREVYVKFCDNRETYLNSSFKDWLSDNYVFLDRRCEEITANRLIDNVFKAYKPVFRVLRLKNTPDTVLYDIIENQRYEFTRQNINAIVKRLGLFEQYQYAAYATLREANVKALLMRVEKNWTKALKSVFPDSSIREDGAAQVAILNSPSISLPDARFYLAKQRCRIRLAKFLRDEVLTYAFDNSLVEASWENIYYYAIEKHKGLPLSFLYSNRMRDKVRESLSEIKEKDLCKLIVFSNDIKQVLYGDLVSLFSTPFKEVVNPIYPARMKILVENNYLEFNETNYKFIKEHNSSLSSVFLAKNVNAFLMAPEKYHIDKTDVIASLKTIATKKSKCDFIRAIANIEIAPDAELITLVYPLVESGDIKVNELSNRLLNSIIANMPEDQRISIGRRAITIILYNKENVTSILQAMGGEFRRLTSDSTISTVTYSRDAILIINELIKNGYVKSCEKKDGKIVVTKR